MNEQIILKLQNVKKYFYNKVNIIETLLKKNKEIKAVDRIDFEVKRGEILAIIGESGSGKTTIGKLIMNLIAPTEGKILFYLLVADFKSIPKANKNIKPIIVIGTIPII